jgi:hypothetical protein
MEEYRQDQSIHEKLAEMRKETCQHAARRFRISGILPQYIMNQHVRDSILPGEKVEIEADIFQKKKQDEDEENEEL